MKLITFLLTAVILLHSTTHAQNAPERTAPYSAVKWLQNNPYVLIDGEWYLLVQLQAVEAAKIVSFCKNEYGEKWQKRFSEDIVEVMQKMGKPLPPTVDMLLIKDGKTIKRTAEMTKKNRISAWNYNHDNPDAGATGTQKEIVARAQKDIAGFANITMEKPFQCKSAKIEFTYIGHKLFAGKETLYIDDYGKTVISIVDRPGMMGREHSTTIWKDNKTTVFNHVKKNYYTTPVRPKSTEPPVISYSTETQRRQGGYTKKGTETIAGKTCDVYEHQKMKVTYWLWKNVDVKLINYSNGGNMGYTKEATSIEENVTIPAELFSIPAGYSKQ